MRRIAPIIALMALVALPSLAAPLTLDQYVGSLQHLRDLLAAKQLDQAHFEAMTLKDAEVESPNGPFHADTALLTDIEAGRERYRLIAHLDATIAALRSGRRGAAVTKADAALLEQLKHEQEIDEMRKGGGIAGLEQPKGPWYERFAEWLRSAGQWLRDKIERFFDWLSKLWPEEGLLRHGATGGIRWIVILIVALIVIIIGILAFEVVRRSRAAPAETVEESAPIGSKGDEDPLSRGATEWERYAAQLAAAGRFREAIRAWYHSVLVTCYSAHILSYRKGRTNWEYVAAVGPRVPWRPEFVQLTKRFELEWYGSDHSSQDAMDECSARAQRILDAVRRSARGAA